MDKPEILDDLNILGYLPTLNAEDNCVNDGVVAAWRHDKNMSAIALIPARAGSVRLPRKNILPFVGKPLIAWSILSAKRAGVGRVVVSTDGNEIADIAMEFGAEVLERPKELATSSSDTISVVRHALADIPASTLVLLQPTSPLRTANDIQNCIAMHAESGRPIVSVTKASPWLFWHNGSGLQKVSPPIDGDLVRPNGAVYVCSATAILGGKDWYDKPVPYLMPEERSVDIDTLADFHLAEELARRQWTEHQPLLDPTT